MRISDWSSDVCASDLKRQAMHHTYIGVKPIQKTEYGTANGVTEADLLAMTPIQTVSYSYDTHGNKTKETISGTSGAVSVAPYSYDSKNRLLRSEEHTSELKPLMRISYAVFCLKKKNKKNI